MQDILKSHLNVHKFSLKVSKLFFELLTIVVLLAIKLLALGLDLKLCSLLDFLELPDLLDGFSLGQPLSLLEFSSAVLDCVLLLEVLLLDGLLVSFGHLVTLLVAESLPKVLLLVDPNDVNIVGVLSCDFVKDVLGALDVSLGESIIGLLLCSFVSVDLLKLGLVFLDGFLPFGLSVFLHVLGNKLVVQIFQIFEHTNGVILVVFLRLRGINVWIVSHVKDL